MVREIKLVVLGTGAVGKSAFTLQFVQHHFVEEYDPTIEEQWRKQCVVDENMFYLDIVDTAGQENFSALRDSYMRTGEGFLLLYSVTDRQSFAELEVLHEQVMRVKDSTNIAAVLVGNKKDLVFQRKVEREEGEERAAAWKVPFFEASAKTRDNVDEAFEEIVRQVCLQTPPPSLPEEVRHRKKKCAIL